MVDHQVIPYCRLCRDFHEESTCQSFVQILSEKVAERIENEKVNTCGKMYNVGMHDWMELMENSKDVVCMNRNMDKVEETCDPKFTPKESVPSSNDLNIDLGGWISSAKVWVPITEIVKIPTQKNKLLKALESSPSNIKVSKSSQSDLGGKSVEAYQDDLVILQSMDSGNKENAPFFVSLLVNDYCPHNCLIDSRASSNVMTKKVMEQLNLRISRLYHNICAMIVRKLR